MTHPFQTDQAFFDALTAFDRAVRSPESPRIHEMMGGQVLSCSSSNASVLFRFSFYDWMKNPHNAMHGGMIAAILDTSMGWTAGTWTNSPVVSLGMHIQFPRPVLIREELRVQVRITLAGKKVIYATSEMTDSACPERVLASATAELFRVTE